MFLALLAQMEEGGGVKKLMGTEAKGNRSNKRRGFSWRFLNDDKKNELQRNNKKYYWFNKDYHPRE